MKCDLKKIMACLLVKNGRKIKSKNLTTKTIEQTAEIKPHDYFRLARNWSDDFYAATYASRNRWRAASLYVFLPLSLLLLLCVVMLVPAQHLEPLIINHYEDGLVSVVPLKQPYAPTDRAEVESEIVRYVINRESYSAASYNTQYSLVNLLSDNTVAKQYMTSQDASNKNSPINRLGDKGYQTVHIESVVFLDNVAANLSQRNEKAKRSTQHHNLAQVDFTVTAYDNASGAATHVPLTALISWTYRGTPRDPKQMWQDWDGFTVTQYSVEERNV